MKLFRNFLLLCLLALSAFAEESMIVPDRPGFSTGTYTVQPGRLNVEMGYEYEFKLNSDEPTAHTLPLVVLRTGITPKLEIDIMSNEWNIEETNHKNSELIVADLSLGGKYRLYESALYNISVMGLLSIPTDGNEFVSDNMDSFLALLWDYAFSEDKGLFGTLQTTSTYVDAKRVHNLEVAIGETFTHTEKFASFVEVYSIIPLETGLEKEFVVDGGITYLITDNTQLDLYVGIGLNPASKDFIGMGIASRF